ncbi:RimL Acetyltransferases, including N-acetylases of ribosomal proteins [Flavobacteriaceae bacterium]|jgi:RimJ/RimL family protein N-acetyltransferase
MNIVGNIVTLKAIELEDLDLLNKWGNDPEIQYWLGGWHFPTNKNDIQKWHSSLSVSSTNQRFSIYTDDLGLIGTANLVDIDWKNKNAFHGMLLGDKEIRGKGFAVDTVMAIMKYAFEELGLNRLDGSMIEYNEASLKMYIGKCGWREEGRQRNWYFRKNQYWDRILVGITKEDYFELIKKNGFHKK